MVNANHSAAIAWSRRAGRRGCGILLFLSLYAVCRLPSTGLAQQPQTSTAPIYSVNAKYVQGVGPGYWPTAGSGLSLNLAAGSAYCGNPPALVTYAGGTLAMTASQTNYVYLNPAATCAPAWNTTGFSVGQIPLAKVVTGASSITSVTDARNWFTPPACAVSATGGVNCAALGTNQDLNLTPSGTGMLKVQSAGGVAAEFYSQNDGGNYTGINFYAVGSGVMPYFSLQNQTTSTYFGDIEADAASGGMKFYGVGLAGMYTDGPIEIKSGINSSNQDITLLPGGTGKVLVKRLSAIRFADQFAGADAGAKIAACIADLPATGGTCDARGLEAGQNVSADLIISKPVRLLLGAATYTLAPGVKISITSDDVDIEGLGGKTLLSGPSSGSAPIVKLGASGAEVSRVAVRHVKIDPNDGHTGQRSGIDAYIATGLVLDDVQIADCNYGLSLFGKTGVRTEYTIKDIRIDDTHNSAMNISSDAVGGVIERPYITRALNRTDAPLGAGIFLLCSGAAGCDTANNQGEAQIVSPTVIGSGNNGIRIQRTDVTIVAPVVMNAGDYAAGNTGDAIRIEASEVVVLGGSLAGGGTGGGGAGIKVSNQGLIPTRNVSVTGTVIDSVKNHAVQVRDAGTVEESANITNVNFSNLVIVGSAGQGYLFYDDPAYPGVPSNIHVRGGSVLNSAMWGVSNSVSTVTVEGVYFSGNAGGNISNTGTSETLFAYPYPSFGAWIFENKRNAASALYLDAGYDAVQNKQFIFRDRGTAKWTVNSETDQAFTIRDVADSLKQRLRFVTGAGTSVNSGGSSPVQINSTANSGTGGLQIWSGGATPVQMARINGNGAAVFALNTVTFSATPTFDAALGNTQKITLTGNVTSSTLSNATAGQQIDFIICQDATGSRTFAWPPNVFGGMDIGLTASKCSAQSFRVDSSGNVYATSAGVTNM